MEISKRDWKLFREKLSGWQEAYMKKLCSEYIELLSSDSDASDKFWELDKRIRADKRHPGVRLELRKSEVGIDLLALINYGVITPDDLEGFSDDLKENIMRLAEQYK